MDKAIQIEALSHLETIRKHDLIKIADDNFAGQDWNESKFNYSMSVSDIINFSNRLLEQFETEFNSDVGVFLPNQFTFIEIDGVTGASYLLTRLKEFDTQWQAGDFNELSRTIRWLINYQVELGFWDKSVKKVHHVDTIELKSKQTEIHNLQGRVDALLKEIDTLKQNQVESIQRLNDFQTVKENELQTISNSLNTASNQTAEITQHWQNVTKLSSELNTIYENQKTRINDINGEVEIVKTKYEDLSTEISQNSSTLKKTIADANTAYEYIQSSKSTIEERVEEAKRLLGLSADAALGGKFSVREGKVSKSLFWWRVAVALSVIVAITWSVIVFKCLATQTNLPYLDIVINLVKTAPGFFFMGYIMAQYNKERAIEEEYAFRAAIAETINAYADLLADSDKNENKSRQIMLLDAIKQVYNKPQMYKEPTKSIFSRANVKELSELIKSLK